MTKIGLKYQRFYSDSSEDANAKEIECNWITKCKWEYNEKWYKEMIKALKYSEISKVVSDLEDLNYTGQIQRYKLQL